MSKWKEIKSSFFNEEEKKIYVDAWKSTNPNEEGKVIAKVSIDGTIEYLDNDAKTDELAQEVVKSVLEHIKTNKTFGVVECENLKEERVENHDCCYELDLVKQTVKFIKDPVAYKKLRKKEDA